MDIIERHKGELFDLFWEESLDGMALTDKSLVILNANPSFSEMLEYAPSELIGMSVRDITHPGDVEDDIFMASKVSCGEIHDYLMAKRYLTKTGKVVWVKLKVCCLRDKDGECFLFLGQACKIEKTIPEPVQALESDKPTLYSSWKEFIKWNWRYLLGLLVAVIVFGFNFWHDWKATKKEVKDLTDQIQEHIEDEEK